MDLQKISVTVLSKNSQQHIQAVLQALTPFGEVVLYDTGSTDNTMEIAHAFPNVRIVQAEFEGFGKTHNKASAAAKHEWVLSIDSDELATPELCAAVQKEQLDPKAVYLFPRRNYFNNKWIKGCGWHPDRQIKLYHRQHTRFSNDQVHEAIEARQMRKVHLDGPILHYSYSSIADFLTKMQLYSTLFAVQNKGKKRSSLFKAVSHGLFAFIKSYILKKGFLDGVEGFVISSYNGHTAFYKYLKLREANRS
jgi:glycosyltransferase involved in cell wall biosynthesis